jgi:hypothetical protein
MFRQVREKRKVRLTDHCMARQPAATWLGKFHLGHGQNASFWFVCTMVFPIEPSKVDAGLACLFFRVRDRDWRSLS